jgi:hypothetical protein
MCYSCSQANSSPSVNSPAQASQIFKLIAVKSVEDPRLPLLLRIPRPGGDLLFRT